MGEQIKRIGIILAGVEGTRLYPLTKSISKQLLPIYDKPMIYYPLTTLMMAGVSEIIIILKSCDYVFFKKLIGDGSQFGIKVEYCFQDEAKGLADAFIVGEDLIKNRPSILILGDNLFHGNNLLDIIKKGASRISGASIFGYPIKNNKSYGVPSFDKCGKVIEIEEKPIQPKSEYAITGLYMYDSEVVKKAKSLRPSKRGELEITDLNNIYLKENNLNISFFKRGITWLDTGTFSSLSEASSYVKILEERQGLKIGCPEEVAWRNNWISNAELERIITNLGENSYKAYLQNLLKKSSR